MGNLRSRQSDCRFDKALDDKSHPLIEPTQGQNRSLILKGRDLRRQPSMRALQPPRLQEWWSEQLPLAACLLCCGSIRTSTRGQMAIRTQSTHPGRVLNCIDARIAIHACESRAPLWDEEGPGCRSYPPPGRSRHHPALRSRVHVRAPGIQRCPTVVVKSKVLSPEPLWYMQAHAGVC